MNKMPIHEMKQILEQKIDFDSQATQTALNRLGLSQRAFEKISYLEYMTTNRCQQDYFSYLHSIVMNIKKLQQEIAKMNLKDKSIDCAEPENIDEIIALLDQRMQKKITSNSQPRIISYREKTQEKDEKKSRIIKLNHYQIKSITERTLVQQQSPPKDQNTFISQSPDRIIHKKLIISNNQSAADLYSKQQASIEASTMEQLNESLRKNIPDKNQTIITGIRQRLKDSNCSKQAIDEFMNRIAKLRSVSQQSIESNRKISTPAIKFVKKKSSNLITTKLEMMLRKEKLIIPDEPLKVHQLKIGSIMGVIQRIKTQKQKQQSKISQQLNNEI
ncbi:unnamed protein product (macronuclear) [Paramecium tetraurelia]|uniref:Uncharacterized protein n=1 Tax=Paramecium tetraurelia TaxID=5888 RepID=A0D7M5_PARTE|nr:uncharacterized protein GSPATT00014009001 [Paramecium tetraurelia]CAK79042.1 unnamed protein product [Paramecium tetraurelia]|eukprot:XP_001446439.1 hypothetical protein (macronuclear) [Paramecium tetraurelia strain d4-2]